LKGLLAIQTKLISKALALWLLEKYDPWDTSLNLPNGKLLILNENVHATSELPIGRVKIH